MLCLNNILDKFKLVSRFTIEGREWNGWNDGRMIDDCVGVLLSYLPLVDKFRLESVSKQWQRKIYWSVGYLCVVAREDGKCFVSDNERMTQVNTNVLEIIIKKCHNIECVEIKKYYEHNLGDEYLSVIANQCKYLSHLKISYEESNSRNDLQNFFLKCGPKLKKLEMNGRIKLSHYSVCVNLEELIFGEKSFVEFGGYFSKLKSIEGPTRALQLTSPAFAQFCELYANQLKRIKLTILGCVFMFVGGPIIESVKNEELMCMFIQINKLVKLDLISIGIRSLTKISPLTESQRDDLKILMVWKKLKDIKISIDRKVKPLKTTLQSLMDSFLIASHFNLESLHLEIDRFEMAYFSQFMCPVLKRLKLKGYGGNYIHTRDGFFQDIHLCFPSLTELSIKTIIFDPNLLIEVSGLSQLESLEIMARNTRFDILDQFITNYSTLMCVHKSLRIINFKTYNKLSISQLDGIIKFASNIPSIKMTFVCAWLDNYNQDHSQNLELSIFLEKKSQKTSKTVIPSNLTVYLSGNPLIICGIINDHFF